jgi:YD repeat-containing protein
LTQVTKPDTSSISYAYDHDGRRISQTVGTDEIHHVWDEESAYGDIVLDYDENDVALASYVLAGDRIISQVRGSTRRPTHTQN